MDEMNDIDDDMADLFSFGAAGGLGDPSFSGSSEIHPTNDPTSASHVGTTSATGTTSGASTRPTKVPGVDEDGATISKNSGNDSGSNVISAAPYRSASDESFLDLLQDSPELLSGPYSMDLNMADEDDVISGGTGAAHDAETQEILAWLDQETPTLVESDEAPSSASAASENDATNKNAVAPPTQPTETVVAVLPPVFTDLTQALASSQATMGQIRNLAATQGQDITDLVRPSLYCRLVTGKSLDTVQSQSSLVDAFNSWQSTHHKDEKTILWQSSASCDVLATRVATALEQTTSQQRDKESCREDLCRVLQYHWRDTSNNINETENDKQIEDTSNSSTISMRDDEGSFLPPVAATLLGVGLPVPVTAVMLPQIMGQHMPVLALRPSERWEAAQELHQHLYWLACYHLPLLVFHLDRYWYGWCAPCIPPSDDQTTKSDVAPTEQARHLDRRGLVPPSWLISFLSGDNVAFLPVTWMGKIWDWILTSPTSSMIPFFLTLAVFERAAANDLILLTDDALKDGLTEAFKFDDDSDWIDHWYSAARTLQEATPASVLSQLEKAVDESVQQAVVRRQRRAEAALQARLAAEQKAHQEAQERKADEARYRLNRARLVAFYRKHAPDKEGNIDQIMENYGDKLLLLEAKLFKKYGESFNPMVKEKSQENDPEKTKLGSIKMFRGSRSKTDQQEEGSNPLDDVEEIAASKTEQVSVLVKAEEVLPVVCWSKEAATLRGVKRRSRVTDTSGVPLKFFLVDSRSEEAAAEQGRFPTAVSLSPETMLDPEKLQKSEEQFESLRGAVHIVILGSGFSAIPKLYNQKLSPELEEAMTQDDSRTNICALFFFKKGFPFVSILDGGFAAAHSWLVREGMKHHLETSTALIDYNAEKSLFGQMEKLHNESTTEKASRVMQNLMEKSLVAMTLQTRQLERLASDMEQGKGRFGIGFLNNRTKSNGTSQSDENKGPRFVNPFANKSNDEPSGAEASQAPRFGNFFNRQKSGGSAEDSPQQALQSSKDDVAEPDVPDPLKPVEATQNASSEGKLGMANPFKGIGTALTNARNRNSESGVSGPAPNAVDSSSTVDSAESSVGGTTIEPDSDATAEETKRARFGGFAAAFQAEDKNAMSPGNGNSQGMQNVLKRNPFRGLAGGARKFAEETKKSGGFGGLRGFGRKSNVSD